MCIKNINKYTMQACRICLADNTKLYNMQEYNLCTIYVEATSLFVSDKDKMPPYLCWECAHRLHAHHRFRAKAQKSYDTMLNIIYLHKSLSHDKIKNLKDQLTSTLTTVKCEENNTFHIVEAEKTVEINYVNVDIKEENDEHNDNLVFSSVAFTPVRNVDLNEEICDNNYERPSTPNDVFNDEASSSDSDQVLAKCKRKKRKTTKQNSKKEPKKKQSNIEPEIKKVDKRLRPINEVLSKDMFTITDLTYEEQVLDIENRKESQNYKKAEFKCDMCYKGFLDKEAYSQHMIRHTSQGGAHKCNICHIRFKTHSGLKTHQYMHGQRFTCNLCSFVATRRHAAQLHERFHNGKRYLCPHCQEFFCKYSTFLSHLRIKHPSDVVCELCGHPFISDKGLVLHKKLKHRFHQPQVPADGPFCSDCGVRFLNNEAMETHLKLSARHRTPPKEETIRRLKKENHSGEKTKRNKEEPIPCEQCSQQLPDPLSYYRHFRRAHPDKNRTTYPSARAQTMCEVCGKMFQSLALLQDHSFTHTHVSEKVFTCQQCGKTFQRKYRLIAHARLHGAAQRRHECGVCGKTFSSPSNLIRHQANHSGVKPFKCEMCGKSFKHPSEKKVHTTYVHLKVPYPKRTKNRQRKSQQNQATTELTEQSLWPEKMDETKEYYNVKI